MHLAKIGPEAIGTVRPGIGIEFEASGQKIGTLSPVVSTANWDHLRGLIEALLTIGRTSTRECTAMHVINPLRIDYAANRCHVADSSTRDASDTVYRNDNVLRTAYARGSRSRAIVCKRTSYRPREFRGAPGERFSRDRCRGRK